jgi:hypothetical protein
MITNHYQNHIKFSIKDNETEDQTVDFKVEDMGENKTSEYTIYYELSSNPQVNSGSERLKTTENNKNVISWKIPD